MFRDCFRKPGTTPRLAGMPEPRETLAIPLPSPLPVSWRPRSVPQSWKLHCHAVMTLVFTSVLLCTLCKQEAVVPCGCVPRPISQARLHPRLAGASRPRETLPLGSGSPWEPSAASRSVYKRHKPPIMSFPGFGRGHRRLLRLASLC